MTPESVSVECFSVFDWLKKDIKDEPNQSTSTLLFEYKLKHSDLHLKRINCDALFAQMIAHSVCFVVAIKEKQKRLDYLQKGFIYWFFWAEEEIKRMFCLLRK